MCLAFGTRIASKERSLVAVGTPLHFIKRGIPRSTLRWVPTPDPRGGNILLSAKQTKLD